MKRGLLSVAILLIILAIVARIPQVSEKPKVAGQYKEVALSLPSLTPTVSLSPTPSATPTAIPWPTATSTLTPRSTESVNVDISGEQGRLSVSVHNGEVKINGERATKENWRKHDQELREYLKSVRQRIRVSVQSED